MPHVTHEILHINSSVYAAGKLKREGTRGERREGGKKRIS